MCPICQTLEQLRDIVRKTDATFAPAVGKRHFLVGLSPPGEGALTLYNMVQLVDAELRTLSDMLHKTECSHKED